MLAAPGRLSMTNVVPSRSASFWPIRRAIVSEPPPGAYGTTKRTGRFGYESAAKDDVTIAISAIARTICFIKIKISPRLREQRCRIDLVFLPWREGERQRRKQLETLGLIRARAGHEAHDALLLRDGV